jgi:hypothetical protein
MKNFMSARGGSAFGGKKVIWLLIIFSLVISPNLVFASEINQYGFYTDKQGIDHYTVIPEYPSFYSGYLEKPLKSHLFYQPEISISQQADKTIKIVTPILDNNPEQDKSNCNSNLVFAKGLYTKDNKTRIKPVCAEPTEVIETKTIDNNKKYYSNLPTGRSGPITKIYPYFEYLDKKVFTSAPYLAEVQWKIIQGATDPAMYYVDKINGKFTLRKILPDKAKSMFGSNYQDKIIYFSDSIIYSHSLGKSIW